MHLQSAEDIHLQTKVDDGLAKVESTQIAVDEWWNDLTPQEQKNPTNVAKNETAERVLETTGNMLTGIAIRFGL